MNFMYSRHANASLEPLGAVILVEKKNVRKSDDFRDHTGQ